MLDAHQRIINYIRVSVTDRCNLRCIYCQPAREFHQLARSEILSYEEILHLVQIAISCGITKVRLTGGDPLVRRDIVDLVRSIARLKGITDVSLTTNGILLDRLAGDLYRAGLRRINISLDSLKRDRFQMITGQDGLDQVRKGIDKAHSLGFSPIKINTVVIRGVNDDEVLDLARLSLNKPYHIRFIEFMPIGNDQLWQEKKYVSCLEIQKILTSFQPLIPSAAAGPHHSHHHGPAQMFEFEGALGKIGLISPLSNHFCSNCNRIRLTADGRVRNCLFSDQEIDIREALRSGKNDEELKALLIQGIKNKPAGHNLDHAQFTILNRPMSKIGG
ncbi:MAG: GTP 3',8-cyclase MoaA [bacterium]